MKPNDNEDDKSPLLLPWWLPSLLIAIGAAIFLAILALAWWSGTGLWP